VEKTDIKIRKLNDKSVIILSKCGDKRICHIKLPQVLCIQYNTTFKTLVLVNLSEILQEGGFLKKFVKNTECSQVKISEEGLFVNIFFHKQKVNQILKVINYLDNFAFKFGIYCPFLYSVNKCIHNYALVQKQYLFDKDVKINGHITFDNFSFFKKMKLFLEEYTYDGVPSLYWYNNQGKIYNQTRILPDDLCEEVSDLCYHKLISREKENKMTEYRFQLKQKKRKRIYKT